MRTTRATVGGALLALATSGLTAVPASADRDDPPTNDRGILEHQVPIDWAVGGKVIYPVDDDYRDVIRIRYFESPPTDGRVESVVFEVADASGRGIPVSPL